jgi:formiminotetrahydrofolate cyclodeaminase
MVRPLRFFVVIHLEDSMHASDLLVEKTVRRFVEELASGDAAPGGGSAAALAGSLAAALAGMIARLTVGRPRYAAHENEMQAVLAQSDRLRRQLVALVDADTAAYKNVMAAYRLPKEDEGQAAERERAIQEAFRHAADIPLAVAEASVQVLNLAAVAAEHGNPHAGGDAAVAGLLAHAALLGAANDVRINLRQIKDDAFRSAAEARLTGLVNHAESTLKRAMGS